MKAIDVLMVVNDPKTMERIRESLGQSRIFLNINTVRNCGEALKMLEKTEPELILLDMDLLSRECEAFLHRLGGGIPLVIMSDNNTQKELMAAYRTGAACYVTKPLGFGQMQEIVQHVDGLRLTVIKESEVESGGP